MHIVTSRGSTEDTAVTYLLWCPWPGSCALSSCRLSVYFHICYEHDCTRLLCIRLPLLMECPSPPFTFIELHLYTFVFSALCCCGISHMQPPSLHLFSLTSQHPMQLIPTWGISDPHHSFVSNTLSYFLGHHFPVDVSRKNILYIALSDRVADSFVWLSRKLKGEGLPM